MVSKLDYSSPTWITRMVVAVGVAVGSEGGFEAGICFIIQRPQELSNSLKNKLILAVKNGLGLGAREEESQFLLISNREFFRSAGVE